MSIAALVKDQFIVNCIVLDDNDDVAALAGLFDVDSAFILDGMDPTPGIGWSNATGSWEPPPPPPPPEMDAVSDE